MSIITRKSQITEIYEREIVSVRSDLGLLAQKIRDNFLYQKIKFPLLEYLGTRLHNDLPEEEQIKFLDDLVLLRTIGGNVIIGVILRNRLSDHFSESFVKAADYISCGSDWYVSDIIGERVFGRALLDDSKKAFPELEKLRNHPDYWVVRAIGPGIHNAVKWGLNREESENCFGLLMKMSMSKIYHIKTGIGWAAKTVATYHPEVIRKNWKVLDDPTRTGRWFLTKVKIGLTRNDYAKKNHS